MARSGVSVASCGISSYDNCIPCQTSLSPSIAFINHPNSHVLGILLLVFCRLRLGLRRLCLTVTIVFLEEEVLDLSVVLLGGLQGLFDPLQGLFVI